jgi:hypothetical protein
MSRQDSGRIPRVSGAQQRPIFADTSDRTCSGSAKHQESVQRRVKVELDIAV